MTPPQGRECSNKGCDDPTFFGETKEELKGITIGGPDGGRDPEYQGAGASDRDRQRRQGGLPDWAFQREFSPDCP